VSQVQLEPVIPETNQIISLRSNGELTKTNLKNQDQVVGPTSAAAFDKGDSMTSMNAASSSGASAVARPKIVSSVFSHVKYEHLVAGITGGVASTLILHPLDLIKIRFAGKF
jgi:hypothetical protein